MDRRTRRKTGESARAYRAFAYGPSQSSIRRHLLARHCVDLPPNVATPAFLGQQAWVLGRSLGLTVDMLNQKAIEALGTGSFLAVAKGSTAPPCFVVARYDSASKSQTTAVLIGKGTTFDSGGVWLKPGAGWTR